MTPEMVAKARANAARNGFTQVEFRLGEIEALPVADGIVVFSGRRNGYGNVVDIRHRDGLVTRYAHNTANLVREGEMVRQGRQIATVGSTGTATGWARGSARAKPSP